MLLPYIIALVGILMLSLVKSIIKMLNLDNG